MFYYCPQCASRRKPVIIKYFPPMTVKCWECGYLNLEYKFIKKDKEKLSASHYIY